MVFVVVPTISFSEALINIIVPEGIFDEPLLPDEPEVPFVPLLPD